MVGRRIFILVTLLLAFSLVIFAGTTGKIRGKVVDAETGEPLAGASVMIQGTSLGSYTDSSGTYFILQVPPGTHTVKCNIVGYAALIKENVTVSADSTTTVDFEMEQKIAGKEEVTVTAKRDIVQKDNTSSSADFSSEELESLVDASVTGAMKETSGVSEGAEGDLHIRGGRSSEVAYIIDGIRMNNNLTGENTFNLSSSAIQEMKVITGGFNAEYGGAQSGIVQVTTQSGQKEFHGTAEMATSEFGDDYFEQFGEQKYSASLSGPIPNPFLSGISFQLNYKYEDDNGYYPYLDKNKFLSDDTVEYLKERYENNMDKGLWSFLGSGEPAINLSPYFRGYRPFEYNREWSYFGNISANVTPELKVKAIVNRQISHYNDNFKENYGTENRNRFINPADTVEKSDYYTFTLTHTLSNAMYYNLAVTSQYNSRLTDLGMHYTEFRGWENNKVRELNVDKFNSSVGDFSWYLNSENFEQIDGEWVKTGIDPYYQRYRDEAIKLSGDFTYQFNKYNQFKTGFEFNQDDIFYEIYNSRNDEFGQADKFEVKPWNFNAYLQDKIEVEDMIINVGYRVVHYAPNVDYYEKPGEAYNTHKNNNPQNTENPLQYEDAWPERKKSAEGHTYGMPRLGVSYPLSDTGVFHFNYGHFYQYPSYQYLYAHIERPMVDDLYGNPNLEAQKTIQYEVGFEQGISDNLKFDVTGYFKENSDKLSITKLDTEYGDILQYENKDFGRVYGLDLSLNKRFADNYSFNVSYSYMLAKGSASEVDTGLGAKLNPDYYPPVKAHILDYNRTHQINTTLFFSYGKDQGMKVFGYPLFELTKLTINGKFASGLPYTRQTAGGTRLSEENGSTKPWTKKVDLKFAKGFNIYKDLTAELYVEGNNIFNWVNVLKVDPTTGQAWDKTYVKDDFIFNDFGATEFVYHTVNDYTMRPDTYGLPRRVRFGVKLSF